MPRYIYTAKNQPQSLVEGQIEAESVQEAIDKLTRLGYFPVSVQPQELYFEKRNIFSPRKVPKKDVVLLTRQLSSLMDSGVNILNGLGIVQRQLPNKYLKSAIDGIITRIKDGKSFSESLSAYPSLFSGLYVSLVRSGEAGGTIEQTLKRLADFLEKEEEFRNSLRQALVYPAFIMAVSILTVGVLLGFVIPRLSGMFADMGQALPMPTQILIAVSGFVRAYWWMMLAAAVAAFFAAQKVYKRPQARLRIDRFKLRLGLFGKVVLETQISRLSRTLSLLLSGGIAVVEAIDISTSVLTNQALALEVRAFKDQVSKGSSLSSCLKTSKLFPSYVANIVAVGEETGSIEKSLLRVAEDYEKEADGIVKTSTRLLEPVIILVMGLVVGFIVLSMLLPIFQINLIAR